MTENKGEFHVRHLQESVKRLEKIRDESRATIKMLADALAPFTHDALREIPEGDGPPMDRIVLKRGNRHLTIGDFVRADQAWRKVRCVNSTSRYQYRRYPN